MPTGYTAELMEKGQSFETFVMGCARAFGACIMMRDNPSDTPIPDEFKPSEYHRNSLDKHIAEASRLEAMTNQERIRYGTEKRDAAIKRYREYLQKYDDENARLLEMKAKVLNWPPPSSDHAELKKFMLQQIEVSMNKGDYWKEEIAKMEVAAPYEIYAAAAEDEYRGIEYARNEHREELKRTASRNNWIRLLRESLKGVK